MGEFVMAILDSDILIATLRGNEDALRVINALKVEGQILATTVINAYELLLGAYLHPDVKEKIIEVGTILNSLTIHSLQSQMTNLAAGISAKLIKTGAIIDFQDIAIATITIANNEILVTRNVKHFERIKELKIRKW